MSRRTWELLQPEQLSERSNNLYDALNAEHDLACVLISAGFLDECLASLIGKALVEDPAAEVFLAPPNGDASAFAVRVRLAFLLGLITPTMRANLRTFGKIRNRFAHSPFADDDVAALCLDLKLPNTEPDVMVGYPEGESPPGVFTTSDPRSRFILAASMTSMRLLLTALSTKHAQPIKLRSE